MNMKASTQIVPVCEKCLSENVKESSRRVDTEEDSRIKVRLVRECRDCGHLSFGEMSAEKVWK